MATKTTKTQRPEVDRALGVRIDEEQKLVEDIQRQTRFEDFYGQMDLPTFQANAMLAMLDLLYPTLSEDEKARLVPHLNGRDPDTLRRKKPYRAIRKYQQQLLEALAAPDSAEEMMRNESLQKVVLRELLREAMGAKDSRSKSLALSELMARAAPVKREAAMVVIAPQMTREDAEYWRLTQAELAAEHQVIKEIDARRAGPRTRAPKRITTGKK